MRLTKTERALAGALEHAQQDRAAILDQKRLLREALANYQRLVAHLQCTCNPEDWATYGDWNAVYGEAEQALRETARP